MIHFSMEMLLFSCSCREESGHFLGMMSRFSISAQTSEYDAALTVMQTLKNIHPCLV